jgi:hypothetical protein
VLERLLAAVQSEQQAGRLVFYDLGALFWRLMRTYPGIADAFAARYPAIIADEHQDASALQDAFVRTFGAKKLVVLADPMQLIHGFRGARVERLDQHEADGARRLELRTGHRWHGDPTAAEWLLALRTRLEGGQRDAAPPSSLRIDRTPANRGFNGMKPPTRYAVLRAFAAGAGSVAVVACPNAEVAQLRNYLAGQGLYPRQLGSGIDFEEAREDIEQLPLLGDSESVARHALARITALVPTLPAAVFTQVERRLTAGGVNTAGRQPGLEARGILDALSLIYDEGTSHYFRAVVAGIDSCANHGHHLPRGDAVRTLRQTAEDIHPQEADLEAVLQRYGEVAIEASHRAPRIAKGLFVMTVHQSKGKEFDAVVLVNASARYFPDNEESRRLFYVAVTRATKSWTVIAPLGSESPLLGALID